MEPPPDNMNEARVSVSFGRGEMFYDKGKQSVHIGTVKVNGSKPILNCLKVNHPNQVSYKFQDNITDILVFEKTEGWVGIKEYFKIMKDTGIKPLNEKYTFLTLSPLYRMIFRQMVSYVHDMHHLGYTVEKFEEKDLFVKGDTLTFVKVGLRPVLNPHWMNFQHAYNVIIKLLPQGTGCPLDFSHLLRKLKADRVPVNDGYCIVNHISLLPPATVLRFFTNLSNKTLSGKMVSDLSRSILKMPSCYKWSSKLNYNGLENLKKSFTVIDGIDGSWRPAYNDNNKSTGEDGNKKSLLRFLRNSAVHFEDFFVDVEKKQSRSVVKQILILQPFLNEICELQWSLCNLGKKQSYEWFE